MGLCCFSNHQYHLYYNCFERAILQGRDDPFVSSDVWYNIAYIYTIFGELELAVEAFKISLNYKPDNHEALNNLAVIEAKKGNVDAAINYGEKSWREMPNLEAAYNLSIWYFKTNQLEKANNMNK
jgi:tetratricopeptide (TPR) repeat protein